MSDFSISRRTHVDAAPERVHQLIDDFREWQQWSPWEGLDPQLRRTYSGADRGVGAVYQWSGDRKAGEGRMEIVSSSLSGVSVRLEFLKPFKATNLTAFDLVPAAGGTDVTWTMTGRRGPVMSVLGPLVFDRAIGKDFDRGLASLKVAAERL